MARDPEEVLKRVLILLDAEGIACEPLRHLLADASYTPPEARARRIWLEASVWMTANLPAIDGFEPEWAREVSDIWEGRA